MTYHSLNQLADSYGVKLEKIRPLPTNSYSKFKQLDDTGRVIAYFKDVRELKRKFPIKNPATSASQYGLMEAVRSGTAKVKGISKKVAEEIVEATPPKVRSKFAKILADRRKKNPGYSVEEMSKEWHGREPKNEYEVTEVESYQEDLAELADLEELGVLGADLEKEYTIVFKHDRPKLCTDAEGKNLEIIGGDQDIELSEGGAIRNGKQLIPVGWLVRIVYETDKHHLEGSNGYPESYEHYFAEEFYKEFVNPDSYNNMDDWWEDIKDEGLHQQAIEEGRIPMLVFNATDVKLMVVGGNYTVEDVGIKD